MKQLFNRFYTWLRTPKVLSIILVMMSVSLLLVYRYFHPEIHRIPSNPDSLHEINFFALGDQGSGGLEQRAVAEAMEKVAKKNKKLDFVILLGDNFYIDHKLTETSSEWNTMFEEVYTGTYLSTVPFYAILGNHDNDLSLSTKTHPEIEYSKKALGSNRWRMPSHYFHNDFGNINGKPLLRIVFLDTNATSEEMTQQANYVREQFISNPIQPIWKIVAGHHTIRSCGKHHRDVDLAKTLLPALQEAKVDAYLSGHDHNQQLIIKKGEPLYVVNGVGGKGLYTQKIHSEQLAFFSAGYGFVSLKANADKLNIDFFDDQAKGVSSHELARDCSNLSAHCIKATK